MQKACLHGYTHGSTIWLRQIGHSLGTSSLRGAGAIDFVGSLALCGLAAAEAAAVEEVAVEAAADEVLFD